MSKDLITALNITYANINLAIGFGSYAKQVGNIMIVFEKVLFDESLVKNCISRI